MPGAGAGAAEVAAGVGRFLLATLRLPDGAFASAQDSESTLDGRRVEGGWYLLDLAASSVVDPEVARRALVLAGRTVDAMAASPLRDVDGGFFRYATRPDWSEPHYERMLYDNAQLLSAATTLAVLRRTGPVDGPLRTPASAPGSPDPDLGEGAARVAADVGRFLLRVLRLADGAFASAQDSESVVDGERVEGSYYLLPPARAPRSRGRSSP